MRAQSIEEADDPFESHAHIRILLEERAAELHSRVAEKGLTVGARYAPPPKGKIETTLFDLDAASNLADEGEVIVRPQRSGGAELEQKVEQRGLELEDHVGEVERADFEGL